MQKYETTERQVKLPVVASRDDQWTGRRTVVAHKADLHPDNARSQFRGSGKTISGAVANLTEHIARFLAEYEPPAYIFLGDRAAVVWCEPDCLKGIVWHGQITDTEAGRGRCDWGSKGNRDAAYVGIAYTLAQDHVTRHRWDPDQIDRAVEVFVHASADRTNPSPYSFSTDQLRRYAAFQRAYQHAEDNGIGAAWDWAVTHQEEWLDRFTNEVATS